MRARREQYTCEAAAQSVSLQLPGSARHFDSGPSAGRCAGRSHGRRRARSGLAPGWHRASAGTGPFELRLQTMPYLQLDVSERYTPDVKRRLAKKLGQIYAERMQADVN